MKHLAMIPFLFLLAANKNCPPPTPGPSPTPQPTPTPLPTPTPTPTPTTICFFPQGVPQADYSELPNPGEFSEVVDQTIREHTVCEGATDCIWGSQDPQVYLAILVDSLQKKGFCAGQHENGKTDQISIAHSCSANTLWENYQPVNFGGVNHKARFAPGNVMSGWKVPVSCTGVPGPIPTPTPTPLPNPTPTPTPQVNCPPSLDRIVLAVRSQAAYIVDATPQTSNRAWLDANGFAGRNFGPMGQEGSSQRPICEQLFAPYTWTFKNIACPNDVCWDNNGNNLQERIKKEAGGGLVTIKALNGTTQQAVVPSN